MRRPTWQTSKTLAKETFDLWLDVNATRLGAALSYYSVFSLGPLLIITIAVAAFAFGEEAARGEIYHHLRGVVGDGGAQAIQQLMTASSRPISGGIAAAASILGLLIGATGVVVQLKDALNTIWSVRAKPGRTMKVFFKNYVVSLAALLGLGFILMASLIVSATLEYIGTSMGTLLPFSTSGLLRLVNTTVSFSMIAFLFSLIFKVLPDVAIRWRDVLPAALMTALMFNLGKALVAFYLGRQSLDSTYGAAASVIVIMLWVFYLAQVMFFGACFSKIYTLRQGRSIEVSEDVEFQALPQKTSESLASPQRDDSPRPASVH